MRFARVQASTVLQNARPEGSLYGKVRRTFRSAAPARVPRRTADGAGRVRQAWDAPPAMRTALHELSSRTRGAPWSANHAKVGNW